MPRFPGDGGFLAEVRHRVGAHFAATGRSERDCPRMYLKTAIILAWLVGSYVFLVFGAATWWQAIPAAVSLGFALAAVGFNIGHDGSHQAYSRFGLVNRLAAHAFDFIGASSYLWHFKHLVSHHTYCNIAGHDADIEVGIFARLSPHHTWYRFHRWQSLYLWPLYALTAIRWHLFGDFHDVVTGTLGPRRIPRPRGWDLALFLAAKLQSFALAFGVPMLFHPWWKVLLLYSLVMTVLSLVLTLVFQLAHCVEEADFPLPDEQTLRMPESWAVHQVQTTVDFCRSNRLVCWMVGGLNFQIEHHLFPRICHIHYPDIARIVEQTCRDFGVRYAVHRTLAAGLASHHRWLRRMGQPGVN